MKKNVIKKLISGYFLTFLLLSCEDFLEVQAPNYKIVSETVFNNDHTALSAMTGIYNQLFRAVYIGGGGSSVTALAALSADELKLIKDNITWYEFEQNEIPPDNSRNLDLWSSAYRVLYMCNSLLEGIEESRGVSEKVQNSLEGEAKFIRAFTYFYLINLYGDVPLLLTTDYAYNSQAERLNSQLVYDQIILDLTDATNLLGDEYRNNERTVVNRYAAMALLARVNLFLENWNEAERLSSLVINNSYIYELKEDLDEVFLANSKEALWQITPKGSGGAGANTNEGGLFLSHPTISVLSTSLGLSKDLIESFESQDKRRQNWIGYTETSDNYYPHKYKDFTRTGEINEYSMVLRFAEQYLIRAEARGMKGDIAGALSDINKIRERAGINLFLEMEVPLEKEQLLELIYEERRKELFTEWGHRWLDLKRTGESTKVLSEIKPYWEPTDVHYPIPEEERKKNPNLGQNPGY